MSIPGISSIIPLSPLTPIKQADAPDQAASGNPAAAGAPVPQAGASFADFLNNALQQVNSLQKDADTATAGLVTGQVQDMHTAMVALEKATLAMSMTVEVRNKVLDAYQAIMNMQM